MNTLLSSTEWHNDGFRHLGVYNAMDDRLLSCSVMNTGDMMQFARIIHRLFRRFRCWVFHTIDKEWLVEERGLRIGTNVYIGPEVIIDSYHAWLISIGDDVTLAPRVHILAHDATTKRHLGYTKIGRVSIGRRTFIGAGSIILPNVTIGDDCIIGAGSVVTRDIPHDTIAAGNPAVAIGQTSIYVERHRVKMKSRPVYSETGNTICGGITRQQMLAMWEALEDGIGYIE